MRFLQERINRDINHIKTENFTKLCRGVKNAFTRIRKISLFMLLMTILERKGLTLSMEIRNFKGLGIIKEKITKTAYLNQRKKLNPVALLELCKYHNRGLYDDGEMKKYKGYFILASDGSDLNIPTTKETLEVYGSSSRKGVKLQASLGLSCLYDCINRTILTCSINRGKFNEALQAEAHLKELPELVGECKSIIILDRGYPSLPLLMRLDTNGQKFLIRLGSKDFKNEQQSMKTKDEMVDIVVTKSRLAHYKGTETYDQLMSLSNISLRMVKVFLDCGTVQVLITNLDSNGFDTDEISALYKMRWGIETAFDTLKNKLMIENFTGTKPVLIEQDIYASIYVCNLASDLIADAQAAIDASEIQQADDKSSPNAKKHPMAINRSFAIGIIKDLLIKAIISKSTKKKTDFFNQMIEETKMEVLPVRHGRSFSRSKGQRAAKFANSRKRVF
jgi:hypothetical protein